MTEKPRHADGYTSAQVDLARQAMANLRAEYNRLDAVGQSRILERLRWGEKDKNVGFFPTVTIMIR
jgi:hypothetical protein